MASALRRRLTGNWDRAASQNRSFGSESVPRELSSRTTADEILVASDDENDPITSLSGVRERLVANDILPPAMAEEEAPARPVMPSKPSRSYFSNNKNSGSRKRSVAMWL